MNFVIQKNKILRAADRKSQCSMNGWINSCEYSDEGLNRFSCVKIDEILKGTPMIKCLYFFYACTGSKLLSGFCSMWVG